MVKDTDGWLNLYEDKHKDFHDTVSSFKVGKNSYIELCNHHSDTNLQCIQVMGPFTTDNMHSWNDKVSKVRVVGSDEPRVTLFSEVNFEISDCSRTFIADEYDQSMIENSCLKLDYSDKCKFGVSSLIVPDGLSVVFYDKDNFDSNAAKKVFYPGIYSLTSQKYDGGNSEKCNGKS